MSPRPHVTLIGWHAEEAAERAAALRAAGYEVGIFEPQAGLPSLLSPLPEAFVVDLGRLPSQGRDVAVWLRQRPASRPLPLVFLGGVPAKVERLRALLPDAVYAPWDDAAAAVARGLANPPVDPVVPGAMDAYAGTPLPKKLGIKAGATVALLNAPADFERTLGELPAEVRLKTSARGAADLILLFARSRSELIRRFPAASRALRRGGGLWLAWPKKSSILAGDLTQADVRRFGLERDFVDYKIARIDDTWAGLLFARRRPPPGD